MKELFSFRGRVSGRTYFLAGLLLFLFKSLVDRAVANIGFHQPWSLLGYTDYRFLLGAFPRNATRSMILTLLAVSLPFIWVGIAFTLKRLRDGGLPEWLVAFIFIPVLKFLFFLFLSGAPPQTKRDSSDATSPPTGGRSPFSAATITTAVGVALAALVIVLIATKIVGNYAWSLFVVLPFCMGLTSAMIVGPRGPIRAGRALAAANLTAVVLGALLLAVAVEGAICVLMAAPLALALTSFGGIAAYVIRSRVQRLDLSPSVSALLLFVPVGMAVERAHLPPADFFAVTTSIRVKAPADVVWRHVIAFSPIAQKPGIPFRLGIAYPISATIAGRGAGAVRRCVFSTGTFVEPITVWDEPRILGFSVTQNPPPMRELSPYSQLSPPHLNDFLVSRAGEFRLRALSANETELTGTTWYRHSLWPVRYWRVWSDLIIHSIHNRVLDHIRTEAEREAAALASFS